MANVQKYQQHGLGHLCKHFERARDENGQYIKFGNRNIDPGRTHLNYNLAPERESQYGFVMKRCKEVYCLKRKDVNLMCSCIVTAPKDLPAEEHDRFFKSAYDFLSKRYGEENVISAYVHVDEGTPHLHYAWVPICYDKAKDRWTVSAKNVVTRHDLKTLHPDLERHVSRALGYDVHVMTGELANRPDLTLPQYKTLKQIETQLERAEAKLGEISEALKALQPVLVKIEEIEKIQPKETLTGALKGIALEDVERLKAAAKKVPALEKEISDLRFEYRKIEKLIPSLEDDLQREAQEERLSKMPSDVQQQIMDGLRELSEPSKINFPGKDR